jgi:molybdate transport system regulatory protein
MKPARASRVHATPAKPVLRARVWIELSGSPALTDAGADLLEQIEATGSLSQAARTLHYSYRRAWLLLDAMNRRWPKPLVTTSTGGPHGGGAALTDLGRSALHAYRDLQVQLQHTLDQATPMFRRSTRSAL